MMQLQAAEAGPTLTEVEACAEMVPLADAALLDLGCGSAAATLAIARDWPGTRITAMEVDVAQHSLNLARGELPGVRFVLGGAQEIPAHDGAFYAVLMF